MTGPRGAGPAAARIFVGRTRELATLRGALQYALGGRGRIVLLAGEPGMGKSRTAEEIAGLARRRGAEALLGRCYEGEGAPAFWPWAQILGAYVRERDAASILATLGGAAPEIAQISPELAERLAFPARPSMGGEAEARFRLLDAVARFLRRAAEARPLALIFDDLQGADQPSLHLLCFVAREMHEARLLVVGTFRDVSLARDHPLTQALGELLREGITEHVKLAGWSEAEVAEFIAAMAGVLPPAELAAAVHSRTQGNPLFVSEVVRLLREDGRLGRGAWDAAGSIDLPTGVRVAIGRRVAQLSPGCVEVLTLASGFGRNFRTDALAAARGLAPAALEAPLEEALSARIVEPVVERAGQYRFTHALVRDALWDEVPPPRRAGLQRRIGEALELVSRAERDPPLAELAALFLAAADPRAIDYARRAGDRALEIMAYEEAVRQYRVALGALDRMRPADEAARCELLIALGEALNRSGDLEASKETLLRATDSARQRGACEQLARAALAYGTKNPWGEGGAVDQILVRILEEASTSLGDRESALHARVLARLAHALVFAPNADRRRSLAARAVAMARRTGDAGAIAAALSAQHITSLDPDKPEERLAIATELVTLIDPARDLDAAFWAHSWRFSDLLELGEAAEAWRELATCGRIAERTRVRPHLGAVAVGNVTRATLEGRFADAERLIEEFASSGGVGPGTNTLVGVLIFNLRQLQGRLEEVAPLFVAVAAEESPDVPEMYAPLALALLAQGRVDEARVHYERLVADGVATPSRSQNFLAASSLLTQVCAQLGDTTVAESLYEALAPFARSSATVVSGAAYFGAVSHSLGVLAATRSRHEDAVRHLEEAMRTYTRIGARPWLALAQFECALALERRGRAGDEAAAGRLLSEAQATADALGMASLQRRIRALDRGDTGETRSLSGERRREVDAGGPTGERLGAARDARAGSDEASAGRPSGAAAGLPPYEAAICRRDGEFWTLCFEGRTLHLRDTRGLHYLARLLREPGRDLHVAEIVGVAPPTGDEPGQEVGLRHATSLGDAGPTLDGRAVAEYRRRRAELRDQLENAERMRDVGRTARARDEIETLEEQLLAALRRRPAGSHVERARLAVTKGLHKAIERIRATHPSLAHHLATTIRTGYFCSYRPDPRRPLRWGE